MPFSPGEQVHVEALGTGVVREVRNRGRYLVELKGRSVVAEESQLSRVAARTRVAKSPPAGTDGFEPRPNAPTSIDLHGMTVEEALAAVDSFVNDAVLGGHPEVRIIHGRSGGRIRSAVHKRLNELPVVRAFRIDPSNPGVTVVRF